MEALETLRGVAFGDREEAALQAQLARAPRDVGALFGLLQWHARRGERAQVESFAHALWDETDAEGELWRRAAALGRSIDPDNPLYSDDPFAALAEHAARQPARAPLALDAFDLSLSDASAPTPSPVRPGDDSTNVHASAAVPRSPDEAEAARGGAAMRDAAAAFDFLHAPSAQLPASFAGLDLDLDLGGSDRAASAAPAGRPRTSGKGRRGRRGRDAGTRSSDA